MANDERVYLTGYLDVSMGQWDNVLSALPKHIKLTLAEPACISFDVRPCPDVNNRLLVDEVFKDQEAFDFHSYRVQSSVWLQVTSDCKRNYKVTVGGPSN